AAVGRSPRPAARAGAMRRLPRARLPRRRPSLPRARDRAGRRRGTRRARPPSGRGGGMRILLWHVHGSWTTAFVQGDHDYLIPVLPDRGPDGLGRAINEARRRGRVTGTDLLPRLNGTVPFDLFGIDAGSLGGVDDPPQELLHRELPRRRVYLHPIRWTSLGLTLLEAMHMGVPVV